MSQVEISSSSGSSTPPTDGSPPVASMTMSGASSVTSGPSMYRPSWTSTPACPFSRSSQPTTSPISARPRARAAVSTWPPSLAAASNSRTLCPRKTQTSAASSLAGPPPTTMAGRAPGIHHPSLLYILPLGTPPDIVAKSCFPGEQRSRAVAFGQIACPVMALAILRSFAVTLGSRGVEVADQRALWSDRRRCQCRTGSRGYDPVPAPRRARAATLPTGLSGLFRVVESTARLSLIPIGE